jgi:tetratricopeptide (TPR) repeat protein
MEPTARARSTSQTSVIVIAALALAAITAFVYAPVRHFAFVNWDDEFVIVSNRHLSHGLTWQSAWWAFTTTYDGNWIPLTWLSHLVDVSLFGRWAGGHHLDNLAIHLVNVVLLFVVLRRLTADAAKSFAVAALFALHPLNVGSVAWVTERKGLLGATGFLLALWAYQRYTENRRPSRYALVALAMAASVMAKPIAVTLPLVLLLLDLWPLHRVDSGAPTGKVWLPLVVEKLPLAALSLAVGAGTFLTQRQVGAVAQADVYPFAQRLANAPVAYVRYLGKLLWPVDLSAYYPLPPHILPAWWVVIAAALLLFAFSVAALRFAAERPYVLVGWLWFVVMLLPAIGLVQISNAMLSDRFMYLPAIGVFIVVAWGLPDLLARVTLPSAVLPVAGGLVLVALASDARVQLNYWQDSLALWERSLAVTPAYNVRALFAVPDALAAAGRTDEAIARFREGLGHAPTSADLHNGLGRALFGTGALIEARQEFTTAIALDPGLAEAHNNLGAVLALQGEARAAIDEYSAAVRIDPDYPLAHYNLGLALAASGQTDAGLRECLDALQRDPAHADWEAATARLYAQAGQRDQAIAHLHAALAIDPNYAPARDVLKAIEK